MRILVISNLYPPYSIGGYEQACHDMVEGLRERGHHVEVLTSTYGVEKPIVANGIHRLVRLDPFWDATAFRTDDLRGLWRWNWRGNRYVGALVKAMRPDVAYVWSMLGMPMSLLTTLQTADLPLLLNVQDNWLYDHLRYDRWLRHWSDEQRPRAPRPVRVAARAIADRFAPTRFPRLDEVNAQYVSAAFAAVYAEKGWHFGRERVIYNGIDVDCFSPTARRPGSRPVRLLFMGRLDRVKGAHVAIGALALLARQRGRDVATLTIVGDSKDEAYQQELHHMVHNRGLDDLVDFRGAVSRLGTAEVYAEHDVLLFPSSWLEGFSLVLLEALARGMPVVGTITGGSAEVLQDGVTGLTIPPEDATTTAQQISRLIDDHELSLRLRAAGSAMVRHRFDQRRIVEQVEEYLSQIVQGIPTTKGLE